MSQVNLKSALRLAAQNDSLQNCVIVDWLTFSHKLLDLSGAMAYIGLAGCKFDSLPGSRLKYEMRATYLHITIHYTTENCEKRFNPGVCIEMSGQGCREFETYSKISWEKLFSQIYRDSHQNLLDTLSELDISTPDYDKLYDRLFKIGLYSPVANCSRIDLAYDDFTGKIDINAMADQARRFEFTSRLSHLQVTADSDIQDSEHLGISVLHGSKSSNVYFRFYDKRVERKRYDLDHWIRAEIQFRHEGAQGVVDFWGKNSLLAVGSIFSGVLANYLTYRDPCEDSNKSRWQPSPWWLDFLEDAEAISVITRKDVEYNKERMDRYAYEQNHNHTLTEIGIDGLGSYLLALRQGDDLPEKYRRVAQSVGSGDRLDYLSRLDDLSYLKAVYAQLARTIAEQEAKQAQHEAEVAALAAELRKRDELRRAKGLLISDSPL